MSDAATEIRPPASELGQATIVTLAITAFLGGYLLSPAPVMLAFNHLSLPDELRYFTEILYIPISLCYQNSEVVKAFYDAWFAIWGIS